MVGYSLNDFVWSHIRGNWINCEVELELDMGLPEIYPLDVNKNLLAFVNGIFELAGEIQCHNKSSRERFIGTRLEGDSQFLELAWSGEQLSEDTLSKIRQGYEEGYELDSRPPQHGTKIAGYGISRYGGKITIENFDHPVYSVRNVVGLPLEIPVSVGKP